MKSRTNSLSAMALGVVLTAALLLSVITPAQRTVAKPPTSGNELDEELSLIAEWLTGDYDTFDQVAADEAAKSAYVHDRAVMHIIPIALPGLADGNHSRALYVEKAGAASQDKPYDQRIYILTREDGRPVLRPHRFKEPEKFVGAYNRKELLAGLAPEQIELEQGCDLVLKTVSRFMYRGEVGTDGTCQRTLRGAVRVTSKVEIGVDHITSLDQGWDESGKLVWGPPEGAIGLAFVKRLSRPFALWAKTLCDEFAQMRAGSDGKSVFWYVEGTIYKVKGNGVLEPVRGLAGYSACRAQTIPASRDYDILTREILFGADLSKGEIKTDMSPIKNEIRFKVGVQETKPMAGRGFTLNGNDISHEVKPSEIVKVIRGDRAKCMVWPLVDSVSGNKPYWSLDLYEFDYPWADSGKVKSADIVWQRDTDMPEYGRVHMVAVGKRYSSISEMAAHSPLAKKVEALVRKSYPDFLDAPEPAPPKGPEPGNEPSPRPKDTRVN